jgi:DNA-binding transcriptional regulator YdaS (Cro superfamily)
MNETPLAAKDRAVAAVGGVTRLAEKIGVTRSAVSQWPRVPVERVLDVERVTGVPRHELRPDIYPAPEGQAA